MNPGARDQSLPVLSSSASIEPDGSELILSVTNRHLTDEIQTKIAIEGAGQPVSGTLTLLTSENVRDYNDVQHPDRITLKTDDYTPIDSPYILDLPPHSIATIRLRYS